MRIVNYQEPNVNWIKKRPVAAGLFLDFGDGQSVSTASTS